MNRRKLLAIGGIGITSIAGCFGLGQTLSSEDTEEPSADNSNQEGESPDISAEQVNSTDTPPTEREETTPENTTRNESNETTAETNESAQDTPDTDPKASLEIVDHQTVFYKASDPNYEQDELYAEGTLRNTADHPIRDIVVDGWIYSNDEKIAHGQTEYAHIQPKGELPLRILFQFKEEAKDGSYELKVTAAKWA